MWRGQISPVSRPTTQGVARRDAGLPIARRLPLRTIGTAAVTVLVMRVAWPVIGVPLVINTTASEPCGLYWIKRRAENQYARGMTVAFPVPAAFESLISTRWLAPGRPLLKGIGAIADDRVCVGPERIEINGSFVGPVAIRDSQGLPLPVLRGCFTVRPGEFLPLSTYSTRSFDGRYFGPQPLSSIVGEAKPLWTF